MPKEGGVLGCDRSNQRFSHVRARTHTCTRMSNYDSTRHNPTPQSHSDHLRSLARRVERLAVSGRTDPEIVVLEKHSLARDMRRLAKALETG